MPNHVYSVLKFNYHDDNGEMIKAISEKLQGESSPIDFNKLIPQPVGIQDEREGVLSNEEYHWCKENWGTKWNAYDASIKSKDNNKLVIFFQTAWNIAEPIINKLFEEYPSVDMSFVAADDGGWFAYHITKNENEEPVVRCWDKDEDRSVRQAIFEAINCYY